MKISEVLNESKYDIVDDPDTDKVPHLVMQIKKAIDNGGRSPIIFKDGDKVSIPISMIVDFLNRYDDLKPRDREEMQALASKSKEDFINVLKNFQRDAAPKSNYY